MTPPSSRADLPSELTALKMELESVDDRVNLSLQEINAINQELDSIDQSLVSIDQRLASAKVEETTVPSLIQRDETDDILKDLDNFFNVLSYAEPTVYHGNGVRAPEPWRVWKWFGQESRRVVKLKKSKTRSATNNEPSEED